MSAAARYRLTGARLTLRVWLTSGWITDLAWGIRVGTLAGVAVAAVVSQVPAALGWW